MRFSTTFLLSLLLSSPVMLMGQQKLLVIVQQQRDSVLIINTDTEERVAQIPIGKMAHEICYDPKTKRCFITNFGVEDYDTNIGTPGKTVSVIDPYAGKLIQTFETCKTEEGNMPHGIKVRPGKKRELFVNIERPDEMQVYDIDQLKIKRTYPLPHGSHNFIFSEDGKSLWLFAGIEGVYRINPRNGKILVHQKLGSAIRGLCFYKDDILASGNNELYILDSKTLAIKKHMKNLGVGQIIYSTVTLDGKFIIAPAPYQKTVLFIDADNGNIVQRVITGKAPINVQVSGGYAYVSNAQDEYLSKINLKDFSMKQISVAGTNGILILE
jgi:DNA-binding beta-propeller fold protein YncE